MLPSMNELARPLPRRMTADEFLLWPGDGTRRRFHLIDGDVRAMSPASSTHSVVQGNLAYLMGAAVRQQAAGLHVATEAAIIPALAARNNVRVPDLVVIRGRTGQGEIAVPDPVAVVEILSPGNASTTRENIRACATLTSVREMAVVSTSGMEVEVHRRDAAGAWPPSPDTVQPGGRLKLASVGLDCPIEEIYAGTWLLGSSGSSSR